MNNSTKNLSNVDFTYKNEYGTKINYSTDIDNSLSDSTFAALVLTSIFVFIGGNLLLLDKTSLISSSKILLTSISFYLLFFTLSRVTKNLIWGLVITYLIILLIVFFKNDTSILFYFIFIFFCLFYFFKNFELSIFYRKDIIIMSLTSSLLILGCMHSYTSFDMLNRISRGHIHQDTLFHSSISAMIKNYSTVSTGLNGLVATPYHAMSHALFAGISLLSGIGVVEVYGIAPFLIFSPILVFSIVSSYIIIKKSSVFDIPIIWNCVSVILIISPILFSNWAVSDNFSVSESYLVSLGLFSLGLPFLYKLDLSLSDKILVIILATMIAQSKASVGLVYLGLSFVCSFFFRHKKIFSEIFFLCILFLIVCASLYKIASAENDSNAISFFPFHFIRTYSLYGYQLSAFINSFPYKIFKLSLNTIFLSFFAFISFVFIHFIFFWTIVINEYKQNKLNVIFKNPLFLYSFTSFVIGFIIISLFFIPGGSAGYFSNVSFFISIPIAIELLLYLSKKYFNLRKVLLFSCISVFLMGMPGFFQKSILNPKRKIKIEDCSFVTDLYNSRNNNIINIAFISDDSLYERNPITFCSAKPFIYPALSERPWVGIIQSTNGCEYYNYGYSNYGFDSYTGLKYKILFPELKNKLSMVKWINYFKR